MYPVLENRPVWIEVNTDQLRANLEYVKTRAGNKEIWAVVKADAYNHGIDALFAHFIVAGISHFCVGNFDEACQLQAIADAANEKIMLLIFGRISLDKLGNMPGNWSVTISDLQTIEQYTKVLAETSDKVLTVQVKVDSGMNRRGFKIKEEFIKAWEMLKNNPQYDVVGLYTHFSTSDTDIAFMQEQVQRFLNISGEVSSEVKYVHAQNSYGLLNLGEDADVFNVVRVGGLCYGMTGQPHETVNPIFSLYGDIIEVKSVKKGETISYGNTHTFTSDGYVGIVPIGYADGWRKINTNLSVYVQGKPCQIVGDICMEQMMIFAEEAFFSVGDTAELIGDTSSMFAVAAHNQITDYELICSFLSRVPRKYITTRKG